MLEKNVIVGVLHERQLKIKVDIMNREDGQYSVFPTKNSTSLSKCIILRKAENSKIVERQPLTIYNKYGNRSGCCA